MTGRRQPQRIPPPIDHGSERIDAELVLREYPGDLGLALWKTARSVRLWTGLAAKARGAAFHPAAHGRRMALLERAVEDAALRADLGIAAGVLLGDEADGVEVAQACARISRWASGTASTGTVLEFAQAAAFADPTDAAMMWRVASTAITRGEYARGESWCRQTLAVARRTRNWAPFVFGLMGLASVSKARGNLPTARKSALRALRVAKRHSLREMVGYAYTALLGFTNESKTRDLERYARGALEALGPGHAWLPALANNIAGPWMDTGYFAPALKLYLGTPHDFGRPEARLGIAANVARAAAGVGELAIYRDARDRCERMLENPPELLSAAASLVNLARAGLLAGDWDYAEHAAERAGRLSEELGQATEALLSEALLGEIRADRLVGMARRAPSPVLPPAVERLAADLSAALVPAGAE